MHIEHNFLGNICLTKRKTKGVYGNVAVKPAPISAVDTNKGGLDSILSTYSLEARSSWLVGHTGHVALSSLSMGHASNLAASVQVRRGVCESGRAARTNRGLDGSH